MTHPNHETALMLLRAAWPGAHEEDTNIFFANNCGIDVSARTFLAMAAAVDAREKAMREALLNAANQFEFYRYQHMGKNPPDEAKAKTNADWRDACLATLAGAAP